MAIVFFWQGRSVDKHSLDDQATLGSVRGIVPSGNSNSLAEGMGIKTVDPHAHFVPPPTSTTTQRTHNIRRSWAAVQQKVHPLAACMHARLRAIGTLFIVPRRPVPRRPVPPPSAVSPCIPPNCRPRRRPNLHQLHHGDERGVVLELLRDVRGVWARAREGVHRKSGAGRRRRQH